MSTASLPIPSYRRATRRRRLTSGWLYAALVVMVLFCLLPFYWMVVTSLKNPQAVFDNSLVPSHPTFMNYSAVFGGQNSFAYALRNSVVIAGSVTVLVLVFGTFAAYALARLRFRGKNLVLGLFLATSMFPGVAILTPLFQLFANLGWIDTYQSMVIPDISFSLPLGIWILASFFRAMPWELERPPGWTGRRGHRRSAWWSCRWRRPACSPRPSSSSSRRGTSS